MNLFAIRKTYFGILLSALIIAAQYAHSIEPSLDTNVIKQDAIGAVESTVSAATGGNVSSYSYKCNMTAGKDAKSFAEANNVNSPVELSDKNAVVLRILCQVDVTKSDGKDFLANISASTSLPSCTDKSQELCVVDSSKDARAARIGETLEETELYFLVANPGSKKMTLDGSLFSFSLNPSSLGVNIAGAEFNTIEPIELGQDQVVTSCRVSVSGVAEDRETAHCSTQGCAASSTLSVENGKLYFQVSVFGASGDLSIPKDVEWTASSGSGPDSSGLWSAAPVQTPVQVQAKVSLKNGNINYCTVRFQQKGIGYTIGLNKFGDCPYYRAVRNYYYLNAQDTGPQVGGYSQPLRMLGFDAQYGKRAPEIPFRGVLNVAENIVKKDISIQGGQVVIPSLNEREFSKAIVVAKVLSRDGRVGNSVYWGELNPNDYSVVKLNSIGSEPDDENTLLVFQTFLAAKQISGGADIRGVASNSIPYHQFTDAIDEGKPYDRLVPFMNESCTPVFQISPPARKDKVKTAEMRDTASCAFSRPFKVGDFKAGRVRLSVLHMTPVRANHEYPLDILKTMLARPLASAAGEGSSVMKACWKLPPFNFHDSSQNYLTNSSEDWATGSASSPAETVVETSPGNECSLSLSQRAGEGNGRMGVRWSISAITWGRGFMDKVKKQGAGRILVEDSVVSEVPLMAEAVSDLSMFNGYLSSDSAGVVKRKTFVLRKWGYDTGSVESMDSVMGKFEADICPGSQFNYDNVSLSWSPLILDLEGRGIKISRKAEESRAFKIRSPSSEEAFVDWPLNVSEVGILTLPNPNGEVKSIAELFGDDKYKNGFEKLKTLDANKDGKVDKSDPLYSQLRLWMDLNRDGVAEKSELFPLLDKGVTSINVKYTRSGDSQKAEERVLSGTYFNSKKGKLMNIEDVYFYEYKDSQRVSSQGK